MTDTHVYVNKGFIRQTVANLRTIASLIMLILENSSRVQTVEHLSGVNLWLSGPGAGILRGYKTKVHAPGKHKLFNSAASSDI